MAQPPPDPPSTMSAVDGSSALPAATSLPPVQHSSTAAHTTSVAGPSTATRAPSSPTHTRKHSTSLTETLPLDHPSRTHPIHASLPTLPLLPSEPTSQTANINPLTLQPFTLVELAAHKYDELRARFPSSSNNEEGLAKAVTAEQEEIARQIKARMDERARKEAEIDKEIGEMEKIREVERKIYRRRMGGKEGV